MSPASQYLHSEVTNTKIEKKLEIFFMCRPKEICQNLIMSLKLKRHKIYNSMFRLDAQANCVVHNSQHVRQ